MKQSGYEQTVAFSGARSMADRWKPRRGWRHRLLMLWPAYRRAERVREYRRYLLTARAYPAEYIGPLPGWPKR